MATPMPLTLRPELDRLRCDWCDSADEIVIECPHCDVIACCLAYYSKGELTLECEECERPILCVPVAG